MPEHPQQKAAFLSAPKRRNLKAQRHRVVEVLPHVLELVAVVQDEDIHQNDDREKRERMGEKGHPSDAHPSLIPLPQAAFEVAKKSEKGCCEAKCDEYTAERCGPVPLTRVYDLIH